MCLDPFCASFSVVCLIKFLRKFHERTKKWPDYEQSLKNASIVLAQLDSDRRDLTRSKLYTVGWKEDNCAIESARLALETAKKLVDWSDDVCKRTGLDTGSVEFAINYKEAKANQNFLEQCMSGLQEIVHKTTLMKTNMQAREAYLQEARRKTYTALAQQYQQYMGHVIVYTGVSEQTPHPHHIR